MKLTGQARADLLYTTVPLAGNAHYLVNAAVPMLYVDSLKNLLITAYSDVAGSYIVSFSPTGAGNWVPMASVAVSAGVANQQEIKAYAAYMRIDYTNGAGAQATFVLDVDGFPL